MLSWLAVALQAGAGTDPAVHDTLQLRPLLDIFLWAVSLLGVLLGLLDQNIEEVLVVCLEQHSLVPVSFFFGSLPHVLRRTISSSEMLLAIVIIQVQQDGLRLVLQLVRFDLGTLRLTKLLAVLGRR